MLIGAETVAEQFYASLDNLPFEAMPVRWGFGDCPRESPSVPPPRCAWTTSLVKFRIAMEVSREIFVGSLFVFCCTWHLYQIGLRVLAPKVSETSPRPYHDLRRDIHVLLYFERRSRVWEDGFRHSCRQPCVSHCHSPWSEADLVGPCHCALKTCCPIPGDGYGKPSSPPILLTFFTCISWLISIYPESLSSDSRMKMRSDLNEGWEFRRHQNDDFEPGTRPHDALFGQERKPNAPSHTHMAFFLGGTFVYRKRFHAPAAGEYESFSLFFHGISHRSRILVNGHEAGGRTNGFVAFEVLIERFVKPGGECLVEVIADASQMPLARYYTGGGLYRHVELVARSKVSLEYDGIRLNTTSVNNGTADVSVEVHIRNPEGQEARVSVELSHKGKKIALWESTTPSTKASGILQIPNARLWSAESPSLYDCTLNVNKDEMQFRTGFRTIEFSAKGLTINGVETLLRGACIHQEHGIIGAAQFRDAERRRLLIMKQHGFNAVRIAHNPASKVLLEVCDEVGLYVMDELADSWYDSKAAGDNSATFLQEWKADLDSMQANNRLHASVIMNSLCNEPTEPSTQYGLNLCKEVIARAKSNDPTRPVTMGVNLMLATISWPSSFSDDWSSPPKPSTISIDSSVINILLNNLCIFLKWVPWFSRADRVTRPIFDALDIAGYSYGIVWYEKDASIHPDRIMVGTETVADDLPFIWDRVTRIPNLIRDFMWSGWEYVGECGIGTHEYGLPWYHPGRFCKPYANLIAGCGALDLLGNPTPTMNVAHAV